MPSLSPTTKALREEVAHLRVTYTQLSNRLNAIAHRRRNDIHIRPVHVDPQPSPFHFVGNPDPNAYTKALRTWYNNVIPRLDALISSIEYTPLTPRQSPTLPRKPSTSSHNNKRRRSTSSSNRGDTKRAHN